jgi:hypothetical protein
MLCRGTENVVNEPMKIPNLFYHLKTPNIMWASHPGDKVLQNKIMTTPGGHEK